MNCGLFGAHGAVANPPGAMLGDTTRMRAYRAALEARVRPGMRVLDVGSGSGILAQLVDAQAGERAEDEPA